MSKLLGPKKAAILLMAMGEESAAEALKHLTEKEVQQVGYVMSRFSEFDPEELDEVLEEFYRKMSFHEESMMLKPSGDFLQTTFSRAFGDQKAKEMFANLSESADEGALESLKYLDARTISQFISNEHPQTVALILSHLDNPEQMGAVLKLLPDNLQSEVSYRMAVLESIPPGIISEIDEVLTKEMQSAGTFSNAKVGGIEAVAEMLNTLEKNIEGRILANIEETNPELAEQIRELMFTFEDLVLVEPSGIQVVLGKVKQNELVLALKTASEQIKELILNNVSERQRNMILDDIENLGPVRVSDIDAAQQKIIKQVRQLEEEGKIIITGRGNEVI